MSPRPEAEVHWHEGMFLRPQHLQAFAAHVRSMLADTSMSVGPHRWGLSSLELDEGALPVFQLSVHAADLILPDGARVSIPGNARVDSRAFQQEFEASHGDLAVYLGVPLTPAGVGAVADEQNVRGRYKVSESEVADENTGRAEQAVLRRTLNARLFFGGEDTAGYETVKIARLVRKSDLDPEPVLDAVYVPPLLDIAAHVGLKRRLAEICDGLRSANESLGRDLASRPVSFAMETGADPENLLKLHTTNGLLPLVEQTCLADGVHPFEVYRVLCQLAGSLSLFSQERICPRLPLYDHENIGGVYDRVLAIIREHLHFTYKRTWDRRTFEPHAQDPNRYDVTLAPEWLSSTHEMFVGAESELPPEQVDQIVLQRMKMAAPTDLPNILGAVVRGVALIRQERTPAALPDLNNVFYYKIESQQTDPLRWQFVLESEALSLVGNTGLDGGLTFHLYAATKG